MTVVTVVAIAAVGAFFYAFVWPGIKSSIQASTYCAMATCTNGTDDCVAYGKDGKEEWKGSCTQYYEKAAKNEGNAEAGN